MCCRSWSATGTAWPYHSLQPQPSGIILSMAGPHCGGWLPGEDEAFYSGQADLVVGSSKKALTVVCTHMCTTVLASSSLSLSQFIHYHYSPFTTVSIPNKNFITVSLCQHVTVWLCHCITVSLCQCIKLSIHNCIIVSLCHYVTVSQCHCIKLSSCHCTVLLHHHVTVSLCHRIKLSIFHSIKLSMYHCVTTQ